MPGKYKQGSCARCVAALTVFNALEQAGEGHGCDTSLEKGAGFVEHLVPRTAFMLYTQHSRGVGLQQLDQFGAERMRRVHSVNSRQDLNKTVSERIRSGHVCVVCVSRVCERESV